MASPSPHIDEEDFDWDAAVREIDYACQSAIPSTSNDGEVSPFIPVIAPTSLGSGFCTRPAAVPSCRTRQTTLNRYINSYTKENSKSNLQESVAGACLPRVDNFEAEDGAPSVGIDLEAAKTWIYPVNVPLRDYQFSIAKKALFSNTLVVLPTGLGKTLIAAVVMYNYFRWFPEGKIVFSAPSRPLVIQQIEACHNIVGIPQEWTIDMTGQMSPSKRSKFWTAKRVFFVTPQVFEKDIQSGICLTSQLVCLVFDEAHRAMGNYSYCVAVRELMAIRVQLRILALSATPGSKQLTIQNVIDNLCISTLEYRHESDHDVSSYVNGRKLELIEVSMGKEAIEVNSMLLQAIQPFAARLCSLGALPQRDFSTLSPSELLNLRDKFRQAPPHSLPHSKYGEIEAYFCALITFYHIRKLLSSHGIRPAYEMLQAKLNQGSFSKLVSKIEVFWKAKLLMQQFLSHGAPTHKMVKMLEILIDHFKTKNSDGSRVIIFTNFRGSVRDIMNYLSGIGDMIKATEFIGQSSGKTLKGQTQKVQQAVLEKFRLGVYNVIVATSVGEEGLDIMEVDLVICFDANVSPLRMIQRMGRTGRKNDGRVVVLACEGSELKAYLKKKASSQAIRKHLHNGGVKSFNFHPSPRMVPHICKPQVQYLEMSIEQFIPRGKKAKNQTMDKSPLSLTISNEELSLISKYFLQSGGVTRKPSLIAFPCFQAFSSPVGRVKHSFRTTAMFIDAMQDLQGLSFSEVNKDNFIQIENPSQPHNELCASPCNIRQGTVYPTGDVDLPAAFLVSASEYLDNKVGSHIIHLDIQKPKPHCFLFSEGSVSINSMGRVLIDYVPVIQQKSSKYFKDILLENPLSIEEPKVNPSTDLQQSGNGLPSSLLIQAIQNDQENVKHSLQTGVSKVEHKELDSPFEVNDDMEETLPASIGRSRTEADDIELSPRLTHFIEEGIVPESPVLNDNQLLADDKKYGLICSLEIDKDTFFVNKLSRNCIAGSSDLPSKENSMHEKVMGRVNNTISESTYDGNTIYTTDEAVHTLNAVNDAVHAPTTINETVNTPNTVKEAVHTTSIMLRSSSEDWKCSSGEASTSFFRAAKYKRLHKNGDAAVIKLSTKTLDERFKLYEEGHGITTSSQVNKSQFSNGGKEKADGHVGVFIDEEAEVSGDASVSEDEIDIEKNDQYDDSFIDDRISPTEGSAEAEKSEVDMIAFYRRSLLTQSPIIFQEKCQPSSLEFLSSGTYNLLDKELEKENKKNKRKIVFQPSGSPTQEENFLPCDDDFYEGLDLDEVEAQATKLLRCKSESFGISQSPLPEKGKGADIGFICSPSFDLGF